jgi:hypothetical protein
MSDIALDQVKKLLPELTAQEKAEVVAMLGEALKSELPSTTPRTSARGLWADLGPAPSTDEIDEARREVWSNFPRDDI